jgi:hypothetical protein
LNEDVSFGLGNFFETIPAGSFKQVGKGVAMYSGTANGVDLTLTIQPGAAKRTLLFKAEGDKANLAGTTLPLEVYLKIGDDQGRKSSTQVKADFKKCGN